MTLKIAVSSVYAPSIGGIESLTNTLTGRWKDAGCEVRVLASNNSSIRGVPNDDMVIYKPSPKEIIKWFTWADVILQNNFSMKTFPYLLPFLSKAFIVHHSSYREIDGNRRGMEWVKVQLSTNLFKNICVSEFVKSSIGASGPVIYNCYNSDLFFEDYSIVKRQNRVGFVGRLVSDKGCDGLLRAVALLKPRIPEIELIIIGDGPERKRLWDLASTLGIEESVSFLGALPPIQVARELQQCNVLCVPSLWKEPFGIVAIEGIACGCLVVASQEGGLPEAIGECGLLFQNGNEHLLSESLRRGLTDVSLQNEVAMKRSKHIERFSQDTVADEYLTVFSRLLQGSR